MRICVVFFGMILAFGTPPVLLAQQPDVSGTWLSDGDSSIKWIMDQKSNGIHIQEMDGTKVEVEFTCPLNGQECTVKEGGHAEKIMMYFNGDKLVQIRERGNDTAKKRMTVSADGKTLTIETVPLDAKQKAGTLTFRRQAT